MCPELLLPPQHAVYTQGFDLDAIEAGTGRLPGAGIFGRGEGRQRPNRQAGRCATGQFGRSQNGRLIRLLDKVAHRAAVRWTPDPA